MNKETLETVAFTLFLHKCCKGSEDFTEWQMKYYAERWITHWAKMRSADHDGDCVDMPYTCDRCIVDELFQEADRIVKVLETGIWKFTQKDHKEVD